MIIPDNRIIYVYYPMICLNIITILIVAHTLYKEKKLNELTIYTRKLLDVCFPLKICIKLGIKVMVIESPPTHKVNIKVEETFRYYFFIRDILFFFIRLWYWSITCSSACHIHWTLEYIVVCQNNSGILLSSWFRFHVNQSAIAETMEV